MLMLYQQLQNFEKATPQQIQFVQYSQLLTLLKHAARYSEFWRQQLQQAGFDSSRSDAQHAADVFHRLPALDRSTVQQQPEALRAHWPGLDEKRLIVSVSSGSTGVPVRVEKDASTYSPLYSAVSWQEGQWHQRDARLTIAVIGAGLQHADHDTWGSMYSALGMRGRSEVRAAESASVPEHLDWLLELKPAYLKCSPTLAAELAQCALDRGLQLPLKHIISQWERVSPRHRELCQKAFSCPIVDRYSCEEAGWLALACTQHSLHVCSATALIEIVDQNNRPCAPGVPGRVLITPLQSFAMPLLRYDLGDLAQWGEPCSCGLPMPVIGRLWGRIRQMIDAGKGRRIPMPFLGDDLGKLPSIRAFRIQQYDDGTLELLTETAQPLTAEEQAGIRDIFIRNGLGNQPLLIRDQQKIDWGTGRKREEFVRVAGLASEQTSRYNPVHE
jgi:phenylacetate-CoA ligase